MTARPDTDTADAGPTRRGGLVGVVLRGGGWQTLSQLVPLAVNIALTPIIIAGLGIDRYGLFLLLGVLSMILQSTDGGMGGAALRYFSLYAGAGDRPSATRLTVTAASGVTVVATVLAFVSYVLAAPIIGLFNVPADLLGEGTFLLRTMVVIAGLGVVRGLLVVNLNAHHRYAISSITTNLSYVVYTVGTLLTVHQGWGLYGMAATMMVQQVLVTALIVPSSFRLLDRKAVRFMPWAETKEFAAYAWRVQWSNTMLMITLVSDSLVIGAFLPVRQVAYYQTGANFALQMRTVPQNGVVPIESIMGRTLGGEGVEAASREFAWLQRLWVVATTGWSVVAMSAAWFGVTAWLGPDFGISGTVAVAMLAGYAFTLWVAVLNSWTQVLGKPELYARSTTIGVMVNLVLTLVMVVPFGVLGIVAATASSQVVVAAHLLRQARRKLPVPVRPFYREIPIPAAIVTAVVVVGAELLVRPVVPSGALGLFVSGLVAVPGLIVFVLMTFGFRAPLQLLRRRTGAAGASSVQDLVARPGGAAEPDQEASAGSGRDSTR